MTRSKLHEVHNSRKGKLVLGVVSLILTYIMYVKATDTGSWQQYFLLVAFLVYGLNRLYRAIRPKN